MLKVVKAKTYQLKTDQFTRMATSISGHPVQKSVAIHFHPCNPVLVPQNTCSNLFMYLVVFGNIMWKLENSNFYD